jgi:hypothetical protein
VETFVVRIFVPAETEPLELSGVIEHSGTGRSEHFRGTAGLLDVVLHQLELEGQRVRLTTDNLEEEL